MGRQTGEKRRKYYQEGETVIIKATKQKAVILKLDIQAEKQIYKATIRYAIPNRIVESTLNLWEIDKLEQRQSIKRKRDVVYFAKVKPDARIPSKRHEDGCYDIYACFNEESITIPPNQTKMIPTGIASAFSPKYRFNAKRERGSTGTISLESFAGQIDSGYRGEWFIILHNSNDVPIAITKEVEDKIITDDFILYPYNKAICQAALEFVPVVDVEQITYDDLMKMKSERGLGKIGSSGK